MQTSKIYLRLPVKRSEDENEVYKYEIQKFNLNRKQWYSIPKPDYTIGKDEVSLFRQNASKNPLFYYASEPTEILGISISTLVTRDGGEKCLISKRSWGRIKKSIQSLNVFKQFKADEIFPPVNQKRTKIIPVFMIPFVLEFLPADLKSAICDISDIGLSILKNIDITYRIKDIVNVENTFLRSYYQLLENLNYVKNYKNRASDNTHILQRLEELVETAESILDKRDKGKKMEFLKISDDSESEDDAAKIVKVNQLLKEKLQRDTKKRKQDVIEKIKNDEKKKQRVDSPKDSQESDENVSD